jgi:hypothetical protein
MKTSLSTDTAIVFFRIPGIDGEVKPTETFYRNDPSPADRIGGHQQSVVVRGQHPSFTIPHLERRATRRTGIRLGVEASVRGILVLGQALVTHHEDLHRGVGAVVG